MLFVKSLDKNVWIWQTLFVQLLNHSPETPNVQMNLGEKTQYSNSNTTPPKFTTKISNSDLLKYVKIWLKFQIFLINAGLYTGATCSSLGSGLMHTCVAVCARTCQCLAVTEASRCPLTVLFAEAFHGWTTGTLVGYLRQKWDAILYCAKWNWDGLNIDSVRLKAS